MDSIEKVPSTSIPIATKKVILKSFEDISCNLSTAKENENFVENKSSNKTVSHLQISDKSLNNTILDHSYPIMTLAKKISKTDETLANQQSQQATDRLGNTSNNSNPTRIDGPDKDDGTAAAAASEAETGPLMKQQERLIEQQGQMLRVLQELKDIQKEILGLKRKNHELKLTKLRIAAQRAGIKVITKANK